ncbi:hypothetical protein BDV19DRAFT_181410 [Aspergillus venezuelensis]
MYYEQKKPVLCIRSERLVWVITMASTEEVYRIARRPRAEIERVREHLSSIRNRLHSCFGYVWRALASRRGCPIRRPSDRLNLVFIYRFGGDDKNSISGSSSMNHRILVSHVWKYSSTRMPTHGLMLLRLLGRQSRRGQSTWRICWGIWGQYSIQECMN